MLSGSRSKVRTKILANVLTLYISLVKTFNSLYIMFRASLPEITSDYSLNIGLHFRENPNRLEWRDGSLPTPDTPWTSSPPKVTASSPYGRLKTDGTIKMSNGFAEKMTLCGNSRTCISSVVNSGVKGISSLLSKFRY